MSDQVPRGRPSTIGGMVYLAVLAIAALGLILVATYNWRTGVSVLGSGLLLAAVGRVALADFESGMLRVRGRIFDVIALSGLGALMIILAVVIPNQPG
ncbi:MAG: DUF3017 domain-containing protein [Marmoricola sp.]